MLTVIEHIVALSQVYQPNVITNESHMPPFYYRFQLNVCYVSGLLLRSEVIVDREQIISFYEFSWSLNAVLTYTVDIFI